MNLFIFVRLRWDFRFRGFFFDLWLICSGKEVVFFLFSWLGRRGEGGKGGCCVFDGV